MLNVSGPGQGAAAGAVLEQLRALNDVQALDAELDRLTVDESSIPSDLKAAREERERLLSELGAVKEAHNGVRREVSNADLELRDLTSKREKARLDQRGAMNSKEQAQYENLIQQLSGRIEELEDASIPLVDRLESLENEVKELELRLAELSPRLAELESLDDARIADLRAQHAERAAERSRAANVVDTKLLREYDGIRRSRKGTGIVPVKGNKCGGCNVQLPLNVVQRVKSGNALQKCPSCGRILWAGGTD
jgi:predicted  nucleic acid-binding Zn-ribbon protein